MGAVVSRLVSRRPTRRALRTIVQRYTPRGDLHFLGKVDSLLQRGHLVMVLRCGCGFLSMAKNGSRYLVRDADDWPIGSFETLSQAIAALDAHDEGETLDDPRGAA